MKELEGDLKELTKRNIDELVKSQKMQLFVIAGETKQSLTSLFYNRLLRRFAASARPPAPLPELSQDS